MRCLLSVLACTTLMAALARPLDAQQNLFNVPSADITPTETLFFQQQFNINQSIQSNTTISYGVSPEFEVGLNVFSLDLLAERGTMPTLDPPLFLVNAQTGWSLGETSRMGLGTQLGPTLPGRQSAEKLANFSYLIDVIPLPDDRGKLYAGAYYADRAYRGGRGDPLGFMLGFDIPIVKDHFCLVGDYLSGRSGMSVGVIGGMLQVSEHWQVSLGAQWPSPHSHNAYGGVFELTYIPGKKSVTPRSREYEPGFSPHR